MTIKTHLNEDCKIAEIESTEILINTIQDAVDFLGNMYYQGFDKVILFVRNFNPDFFDLKTRLAGDILQKFSNYKFRLAIVGDFSVYNSKSLNDFIYECNNNKHLNFVRTIDEAIKVLK